MAEAPRPQSPGFPAAIAALWRKHPRYEIVKVASIVFQFTDTLIAGDAPYLDNRAGRWRFTEGQAIEHARRCLQAHELHGGDLDTIVHAKLYAEAARVDQALQNP